MLKISGEALGADHEVLGEKSISRIAKEVAELYKMGLQVGIVVGGGNIFRGREADALGITEMVGHQMGMLATLINSLALQDVLEKLGVETRVQSSVEVNDFCEPYRVRRALRHLNKGRVVIFAAGTGNTFFTTDSAAALRAIECSCEVLLKATNVDGVYTADPDKDKSATMYETLSYQEALEKNLRVMDRTAFALAQENNLPILVFNVERAGNMKRVVLGEKLGTRIGK
jgi:uridylate kinase